jgi:cytochrome c peroxidase
MVQPPLLFGVLALGMVTWAVGARYTAAREEPAHADGILEPLGLPLVVWPKDNPYNRAKWELGRTLFFDQRLSIDGSVSCGTCHNPRFAFTDAKPTSAGVKGRTGKRSAPTIINQVYSRTQNWDGGAATLEEQAKGPLTNPIEMGNTLEGVVRLLSGIPGYAVMFAAAFGTPEVSIDRVTQAIATFERTVVSGNSPYDRFKAGDKRAMTKSQIRGTMVFYGRGRCDECHNGLNLNTSGNFQAPYDAQFHNLGVGMDKKNPDEGRYDMTKNPRDWGAFKTPTLREIAKTAPYMHDGSLRTLEEVVDFYDKGGSLNQNLDRAMKPLKLTAREKKDLIHFLQALSGDGWQHLGPPRMFPE